MQFWILLLLNILCNFIIFKYRQIINNNLNKIIINDLSDCIITIIVSFEIKIIMNFVIFLILLKICNFRFYSF